VCFWLDESGKCLRSRKIEVWSKEAEDFDKYIRLFLYDKNTSFIMTNDFISNMMENLAGRRFYLFWVRLRPEGAQGPQHGKNPSSNTRKFPFLENMSRNFSETLGELSCNIQKVRARVVERICKLTPPLGPFPIGLLPSGFTLL
jgi:hypothetical protein